MTNEELAAIIIKDLGGAENILSAANCMTRLRVQTADKNKIAVDTIKKLDGVSGVYDAGAEFQIILGPGKATNVTNSVNEILSKTKKPQIGDGKALHEEIRAKNATPAKLFLKKIAGIFFPLIPGFIACGLITGVIGVTLKISPELADAPIIKLLMVFGNAVFWGMNLFVGFNAGKVFGGTPILGGVLAAIMTHPALANVEIAGENLLPGRGGIISVVLVAAFGAWLEKKLHKIIPEMFDLFLTPLITVLVAGMAAIFILQPIGGAISGAIGGAATTAINSGGAAVGFMDQLADLLSKKQKLGMYTDDSMEAELFRNISADSDMMMKKLSDLERILDLTSDMDDSMELAKYYHDEVIPAMAELRRYIDKAETLTASEYWPIPSYGELLFDVR